jgi:hypothetical protein
MEMCSRFSVPTTVRKVLRSVLDRKLDVIKTRLNIVTNRNVLAD